jgi:hypothetical protein
MSKINQPTEELTPNQRLQKMEELIKFRKKEKELAVLDADIMKARAERMEHMAKYIYYTTGNDTKQTIASEKPASEGTSLLTPSDEAPTSSQTGAE